MDHGRRPTSPACDQRTGSFVLLRSENLRDRRIVGPRRKRGSRDEDTRGCSTRVVVRWRELVSSTPPETHSRGKSSTSTFNNSLKDVGPKKRFLFYFLLFRTKERKSHKPSRVHSVTGTTRNSHVDDEKSRAGCGG